MLLRNQKNNVQNDDLKSNFSSFKSRFLQSGQDPQQVLDELVRTGKVNKEQLDRATKLAQMYSWLIRQTEKVKEFIRSELSSADIYAMTNRNNDGIFGGNGSWFIVLILFFLGMGGGFGWNNNGNANSIKSDLYEGLNSQNTFSEFRSMQNEITNGFANVNQNLCAGFGGVQNSLALGFGGIQSAIADSNYRMADCCCQIKNTVHEENEKTRALIQQNEIQKLRDELQDVKNEQLATGLTTAQIIQTNNLENFIRQIVTPTTAPTA